MSELYKTSIYTAPYDHLIAQVIREYDISKANISILYGKGVLSKEEYDRLFGLDKMVRERIIGNLQKESKDIYPILKDGITEARGMFFKSNNIKDNEILSIKNDAIFVINRLPKHTSFSIGSSPVNFVHKNTYTSFYHFRVPGVIIQEIYYLYDELSGQEAVDVKGIKDKLLSYHKGYFLDFLIDVMYTAQVKSLSEAIEVIQRYYIDYISGSLDLGHYRKFDSRSYFESIPTQFGNYASFTPLPFDQLNTRFNLDIIRLLYKMLSKDLLSNSRKYRKEEY